MSKKWYILQTRANCENMVVQRIHEGVAKHGFSDDFEEVIVPVQSIMSVGKNGKKVPTQKKVFPGYVVVHFNMENASLTNMISSVTGAVGFLKVGIAPKPLSESEIGRIRQSVEEKDVVKEDVVSFSVGDQVTIIEGAFNTFVAVVESVDAEEQKLDVAVSILGRPTKMKLSYNQVEKKEV